MQSPVFITLKEFLSVIKCRKAVASLICGNLETWLALRFLAGIKESILIKIPYSAIGVLFCLLVFEITLVRALELQIALKQPLIGRMCMKGREVRRHKRIYRVMFAGLSIVICTTAFFTVIQSMEIWEVKKWRQRMPDYNFLSMSWNENKMKEEDLQEISDIPGIQELHAWGNILVNLEFPDIQNCKLIEKLKSDAQFLTADN